MTLSLASVYHPCTKTRSDDIYMRSLDTLDKILDQLPQSELIIGADINANIGRFDNMSAAEFGPTLGPHSFQKRNSKEESLLAVYLGHRLQVMNTFFPRKANWPGHGTWTSNQPTQNGQAELHKLNVIVTSTNKPKIWNASQGEIGDGIIQAHKCLKLKSGKA